MQKVTFQLQNSFPPYLVFFHYMTYSTYKHLTVVKDHFHYVFCCKLHIEAGNRQDLEYLEEQRAICG